MIYVDELRVCAAPWRGGMACHLISDESLEELLSFASSIGLSRNWCQHRSLTAHFDLSPAWRARAIRAGARPLEARALARLTLAAKRAGLLQSADFPGDP